MHEEYWSPEFGTEIANGQNDPMERAVHPASYSEPGEFAIAPVVKHPRMQRNHNRFRVAPLRFGKDSFDPLNIGLIAGHGFQRALLIVDKEIVVRTGHVHGAEDDFFVRPDGILNHLFEFRDVCLPRELDGIATKTLVSRKVAEAAAHEGEDGQGRGRARTTGCGSGRS